MIRYVCLCVPELWLSNRHGNDFKCSILTTNVRVAVIVYDVDTLLS